MRVVLAVLALLQLVEAPGQPRSRVETEGHRQTRVANRRRRDGYNVAVSIEL